MKDLTTKRIFDLVLVIPSIIVVLPLLALICFVVWAMIGQPVFYCQKRPGLYGRLFSLYKFRTMNFGRDDEGNLLPDADRLTSFGLFLRSTSLDELPELFNVLRGEMSFVGPRPLLAEYLSRYDSQQARRHDVRPGITGLTQICGRNAIAWEQKFCFDIWYVDHLSLWLDLKIIIITFRKILKREGISQPGQATMERYHGTGGVHGE